MPGSGPIPENEAAVLRHLDRDLWEVSAPLNVLGVLRIGHRMTVMRRDDGGLIVHSPIEISAEVVEALAALGSVAAIVAPSRMHDLYLEGWFEAFPQATFLAAPALIRSRPDLPFHDALEPGVEMSAPIDVLPVDGVPRCGERVLVHRPSGTLVVADLIFNLPEPTGRLESILRRPLGLSSCPAASRLFRALIRDAAAFGGSLKAVLAAEYSRILPGHGNPVESGGPSVLREIFDHWNRVDDTRPLTADTMDHADRGGDGGSS